MDTQITLADFDAPGYHELELLSAIGPDLRAAIENMGIDSQMMSISVTNSYTAVTFQKLTAFRLRIRGRRRCIFIPSSLADLIPINVPSKKPSEKEKYYQIPITKEHPFASYKDFLVKIVAETVNRYPKEWDCCSRYLECSDAKVCTHPNKAFALACGYRRIMSSGRIFYGKNRNI